MTIRTRVVVALALLAGLGVGGLFIWRAANQPRVAIEPALTGPPIADLDAGVAEVSLDEGDTLLRSFARGLSSHPLLIGWVDRIDIRQLAAAVLMVSEGESPRPALPFLSIQGEFVVHDESALIIDPVSYERYDSLTAALTSIDGAAAGAAYAKLRPYFASVFREISRPGSQFDATLTSATSRLRSVKFPEGDIELTPKGALYVFADPALERMSAAEKHLLRFGPKNGHAIQTQLDAFVANAGLADAGR